MKVRKNVAAAAALAVLFAGAVAVYGYFSDIVSVTNHIALGDVNIRLQEFERKNGQEDTYSGSKIVLPGDVISKIPKITNLAEPCWIRARISLKNDREELEGLSEKNIGGISKDWIKKGEYYYYTHILDRGETVTLFQEVEIPSSWTEEHSGQKLELDIQADAIQAVNFKPDFLAMSPWENQSIELCVHEENGNVVSENRKIDLSVEFEGNAHKLLAVPDDFFQNFPTAMPGDTLKDSVEISNTTGNSSEIFFHTGIVCQREDRMDLLRKLGLTISMNGTVLYQGNLLSEELRDEHSLGVFAPGTKETMEFAVTVPKELNNAYALRDTAVKWYFTVYEDDTSEKTNGGTNQLSMSGNPVDNSKEPAQTVKTGDETPIGFLLILGLTGLLTAAAVMLFRKGGKKS